MRSIKWWHCRWPWVPPNHPKPPHFLHFCNAICSFVTSKPRDFKFGTLIYHNKSHPADGKIFPERGVVRVSWPVLEFYIPCNFSATANARDFKFCTWVGHAKVWVLWWVLSKRGPGYVSSFCIVDLENFATASRRYIGDIHNSSVVGLFVTPVAYAGFYAETCQSKGGSGRTA